VSANRPRLRHRPKALFFDLDNTICDHRTSLQIRLNHAFEPVIPDPEQRAAAVEASVAMATDGTDHFPELLGRFKVERPEDIEHAIERYGSDRYRGLELFDDALEVLQAVRDEFTVGMITNGPTDIQQPKIDLLAIEHLFDFTLISESTGYWKPDPRIFEMALDLARVPAYLAVYIGDSPDHDVAGAQAAGIPAVWMNRTSLEWQSERFPDLEVTDLRSFVEHLMELGD